MNLHPRVLIVDDQQPIRYIMGRILDKQFQVDEAEDIASAIAKIEERLAQRSPVELAIIDLHLAHNDNGETLASRITNEYHIPSLITTGQDIDCFTKRGIPALQKPFQHRALIDALYKLLPQNP